MTMGYTIVMTISPFRVKNVWNPYLLAYSKVHLDIMIRWSRCRARLHPGGFRKSNSMKLHLQQ